MVRMKDERLSWRRPPTEEKALASGMSSRRGRGEKGEKVETGWREGATRRFPGWLAWVGARAKPD